MKNVSPGNRVGAMEFRPNNRPKSIPQIVPQKSPHPYKLCKIKEEQAQVNVEKEMLELQLKNNIAKLTINIVAIVFTFYGMFTLDWNMVANGFAISSIYFIIKDTNGDK